MGLIWTDIAWQEYLEIQSNDKAMLKKINDLIKEIQRMPYTGKGKPEMLKGDLSGWISRRIDGKNRIVYKQAGDDIIIASCKTHYHEH